MWSGMNEILDRPPPRSRAHTELRGNNERSACDRPGEGPSRGVERARPRAGARGPALVDDEEARAVRRRGSMASDVVRDDVRHARIENVLAAVLELCLE